MSVESITAIISSYSEVKCDVNITNEIMHSMINNFGGLLGSVDNDKLIYECPNCFLCCETYLGELACCIFRHGYVNGAPLAPHESKDMCDRYRTMNNVEGCCQPYQIFNHGRGIYIIKQCGYI